MSAEIDEELLNGVAAKLNETLEQAWTLYFGLLSVARVTGCGMFIGREAAATAVAGGFDLALSSAEKTVGILSHAERVYDAATALEDSVLAAGDPPTAADLAVTFMRAARLAGACATACGMIEG